MKIGLITLNRAHDFGAVLQTWALQEYLQAQGHRVDIINYKSTAIEKRYQLQEHPSIAQKEAYDKFEHFMNESLKLTKVFRSFTELKKEETAYEVLITGSDQVWNSALTKGIDPAYLLSFGPTGAKRIAYAVSIGSDAIPEREKELLREHLKEFDFISVREENAYREIALLTEKRIEITIDPVFLLQRDRYYHLCCKPKEKHPYIYVHNVHMRQMDQSLIEVAEEVSMKTGLPVVYNKANYHFKNTLYEVPQIGPKEFLGWVEEASYIITNSFHTTAFALIFEKNFITVPPHWNSGRVEELLNRFHLSSQLIQSKEELPSDLNQLVVDYEKTRQIIEKHVEASKDFLKMILRAPKDISKSKNKFEVLKLTYRPAEYPARSFYVSPLTPFCRTILQSGGVVITRGLSDTMQPEYRLLQTEDSLDCLYVESLVEAQLQQGIGLVKAQLCMGRRVLFLGNSCETEAVMQEVKNFNDSKKHNGELFTITTACESFITQEEFNNYIKTMEDNYGAKINRISFSNRIRGWLNPYICIVFQNEEVSLSLRKKDKLMKLLNKRYEKHPRCSRCNDKSSMNEAADLTILVDHNRDSDNPYEGHFLLVMHSDRGRELFRQSTAAFQILK